VDWVFWQRLAVLLPSKSCGKIVNDKAPFLDGNKKYLKIIALN